MNEFELIERFFAQRQAAAPAPDLGIGDDCALFTPTPGLQLAVSSDMLVEGRHFLPTVAPRRLGWKALAVNLSDLAACGATPRAFTFAWSLPRADADFVAGVAEGLFELAERHGVRLIGGDTTAGPLNLCITAFGEVPPGQALLRSGARVGDDLWVSGQLGQARLALEAFRGHVVLPGEALAEARLAMEQPEPRVELGQALRGVASSAIDLSDGLLGDLGHMLRRSAVGAELQLAALPRSALLAQQPEAMQRLCLLAGGDDYELLFSAAQDRREAVLAAGRSAGVALTRCGCIVEGAGLRVRDASGEALQHGLAGFDHFA